VEAVEKTIKYAVELFRNLAAAGHGPAALKILTESPSAQLLEPLIVGLRLSLGEDVLVATEILEVGKDVAEQIEERRKQLHGETAQPTSDDNGAAPEDRPHDG
jgi:hypothetical protein